MYKQLSPLSIFFLAFICSNIAVGQTISRSVISAGGGTSTSGNIMLSINIGEPVADFLTSANGTKLSVGFMQVDNDPALTVTAPIDISPQLVIYPNPVVSGTAKLAFKDIPNGSYNIDIVDVVGHVLYTQIVAFAKNNNIKLDLNVNNFKGGTYFVRVRNGNIQGKLKLVKL